MRIEIINFKEPMKGYHNVTIKCDKGIDGCFKKTYINVPGNGICEAIRNIEKLIKIAEKTIFLEDTRFNGNTFVMAQMVPQTNSSRFFDHILDSNNGYKWVKGYIISETIERIVLLVGDKYEVECFKDNIIIIED